MIKLNGGLGTSMGMEKAKSLLEVKEGHTFLDIIVRQILELRSQHGARLPLVLMDSFHTSKDTLAALEQHPDIASDLPADFIQNKEPKIRVDDLHPGRVAARPGARVVPAGHGDIYTALMTSGTLEQMLDAGYEYAFLSNSDNLGAVLDPRILAWLAAEEIPFLMEVTRKTRGRPQGRPSGAAQGLGPARPARDRADAGRGHGLLPRHRPLDPRQHEQPVGQPAPARRRCCASARACSGCR